MTLELSHFSAAVLFSVFASVVFGITQRNTCREQSATACIVSYVCRRSFRGGMGDVGVAALIGASSFSSALTPKFAIGN